MYRDSFIKVDLDAFKYNIKKIQSITNKTLIAIIKADAYGCGSKMIYKSAIDCGVNIFGVSSLEEAIKLRNDGCKEEIIILSYVNPKYLDIVKKYDFTLISVSLDYVKEICKHTNSNIKMQIKVDTGMNRVGLKGLEEVKSCLKILLDNSFKVEGIFTHFACSDNEDYKFVYEQYDVFKNILKNIDYKFKYIHCCNSDASVSMKLNDSISNCVRVGISLYGLNKYNEQLRSVISLYSKIINIKKINKNEYVGYGYTYKSENEEYIATLPLGYADGFLRKNQGRFVVVDNKKYEIVGRICMDQFMVKLNEYKPVGTLVEIFGDKINISDVADELDMIPYEIITNLSDRLTRIYFENGEYIHNINPRLNESEY